MKPNDYIKLEKDFDFKRAYLNQTMWWKNILMVPPICLLFIGLVGMLYLFHYDKLASLYVIPYLAVFLIGTILLKAIKKHIQKTIMTTKDAFHICLAKSIGEKEGYIYTTFVNNSRRHDKYYITNLAKDISLDDLLSTQPAPFKKRSVLIKSDNDTEIYVRAYFKKDIDKRNRDWKEEEYFPVLYIDTKYTFIVKKKDLISF